jgi:HAMP domain-containing protein
MTDDIVTRLREQALEGIWDFTQAAFDMQNAADEIERLRNALAEQTIIHEVQKTNTLSEIERLRTENEQLKQQIGNDRKMRYLFGFLALTGLVVSVNAFIWWAFECHD